MVAKGDEKRFSREDRAAASRDGSDATTTAAAAWHRQQQRCTRQPAEVEGLRVQKRHRRHHKRDLRKEEAGERERKIMVS
jgi:hypothetical protein